MQSATILNPETTLALDLTGYKLIEASAGTGKTYTISNLYCKALLQGYEVKQILIVTYTNAATDELKTRIRERVKSVWQLLQSQQLSTTDAFLDLVLKQFQQLGQKAQQTQLNRLNLALRSFDESAIYTINGFSQRMLKDYALSSGQALQSELITNDKHLWRNAIQDWWRKNTYALSLQQLSRFNLSIKSFEQFYSNTVELRNTEAQHTYPLKHQSLQQLWTQNDQSFQVLNAIKSLFQQHFSAIKSFFSQGQSQQIFKVKRYKTDQWHYEFEQLVDYFSAPELRVLPNYLDLLSLTQIKKAIYKGQFSSFEELDGRIFELVDDYLQQAQDLQQQILQAALLQARDYAQQQVQQLKQQQQLISFDDQLSLLASALAESTQLVEQLRQHFPIALIDEFQDTNAIQYAVFKRIYYQQQQLGLMMIGDPKQAIYSFRGGDIFTYMQAKQDAGKQLYSLNQNWRSTPQLIHALNHLFSCRDDTFIYSDSMPYEAVQAGQQSSYPLMVQSQAVAALSVCYLPDGANKTACVDFTANQIATILQQSQQGQAQLQSAVKPADIAVLVRKSSEGKLMAQALKNRGVHCINISKDKVLQSDTAQGFLLLLKALAEPNELQLARNLLSSCLYQFEANELEALLFDEAQWISFSESLKALHQLWLKQGFMPMLYSALKLLNLHQHIARQVQAERQLTNFLHIAELMQKQRDIHSSPLACVQWLKRQIQQNSDPVGVDDDEHELRLESDAQLVKIVTVHKSKGLEYPIVFVPFLWDAQAVNDNKRFYKYHEHNNNCIDFAFSNKKQAAIKQDKQRIAEDMRLLYVALTRAQSKLYVVTGKVKYTQSTRSALNFLLSADQKAADLDSQFAQLHKDSNLLDNIKNNLQDIDNIEILNIDNEQDLQLVTEQQTLETSLKIQTFNGHIRQDWLVSSFSRMTRDVHQIAHAGHSGVDEDAILAFKKGGDTGTFLHHLLEHIDFSSPLTDQVTPLFEQYADRYHLNTGENLSLIQQWIAHIVNTPLNQQGLRLSLLAEQDCLNELEFDFSLHYVDIDALNQFLHKRTGQAVSLLTLNNFRGLMKGFIDLVFRYNNQYYIVDYKSNYLGSQLADYTPDLLHQAVINRRYDLQYLLYNLALHRFLKTRLANYDYERDFGGNYYLFLRAMRQQHGAQYGVFFDKPSLQEIELLDTQLFKKMDSTHA